jgi:hypothetical protein
MHEWQHVLSGLPDKLAALLPIACGLDTPLLKLEPHLACLIDLSLYD